MTCQKRAGDFDTGSSGPSCKKTPTRKVTKATFDKWQRVNDRDHQTLVWLCCELDLCGFAVNWNAIMST